MKCMQNYSALFAQYFLQQIADRQSSFEAVRRQLPSFQRETTLLKFKYEKSVLGQAITSQHLTFSSCKTTEHYLRPYNHNKIFQVFNVPGEEVNKNKR